MVEVLKVSSKSNPNSVAGALAGVLRQSGAVEVQVVGAGALNQAVKAIAIARGFVAPSNIDLVCIPTFADIEIDGQSRTAIRLAVEDRSHRSSMPEVGGTPPAPPVVAAPRAGLAPPRPVPGSSADGEIRTRTDDALNVVPLPVGLRRRRAQGYRPTAIAQPPR